MESFYGGLIGLTPDIQIGTVIETDDVTKTEIELDPTSTDLIKKFNFTLPKAKTGTDGKTPTFDIQTIEGGHRITIKIDNQVIDTVDIMDGITATLLPTVENTNLIFSETGEGGSSLVFDDVPITGSDNPVKSNGIYQAIKTVQDQLVIDNVPTTNSNNLVKSGGVKSYVDNAITAHELIFDSSPIEGSSNPVTSDGIYRAIAAGQSGLTIDDVPTDNSNNLVKSGGVKSYVDSHTIDPNQLTTTIPIAKGGTGASSAAAARTSLGITPANIGAAPSSHTHNASDINSGTLSSDRLSVIPIAKGGTNADNATDARTNLGITPANIGAAPSQHTHAFSDITGGTITTDILPVIPIEKGGTGATDAAAARTSLGIIPVNIGAAQIQTGSYVGTGTFGSAHPTSITLNSTPKLLIVSRGRSLSAASISSVNGGSIYLSTLADDFFFVAYGAIRASIKYNYSNEGSSYFSVGNILFTWNHNLVSWYTSNTGTGADANQLNASGQTYYYYAIM